MQIIAKLEHCAGHGQCELVAPELFEVGEDGLVRVLVRQLDGDQRLRAEQAVRRCPEGALVVVE